MKKDVTKEFFNKLENDITSNKGYTQRFSVVESYIVNNGYGKKGRRYPKPSLDDYDRY